MLVNFLAPFQHAPEALADLFKPAIPDLHQVLPIENPNQFLAFEWIPPIAAKGERIPRFPYSHLKRGIGSTSIDFALLLQTTASTVVMILGEGKYTERYSSRPVTPAEASKRLAPYADTMKTMDWIGACTDDNLSRLATEPIYRLFRQHVMAIRLRDSYARRIHQVRLFYLYVSPDKAASEGCGSHVLREHPGIELLTNSSVPFHQNSFQKRFRAFPLDRHPELANWQAYILARCRL